MAIAISKVWVTRYTATHILKMYLKNMNVSVSCMLFFSMIMEMLGSAQVKEDDEEYQSPLDILFERLEMRNPESIAVKQERPQSPS